MAKIKNGINWGNVYNSANILTASGDYDGDHVSNIEEIAYHHTEPMAVDTDGDNFSDAEEVERNTNPIDPTDYPIEDPLIYYIVLRVLILKY